MTQGTTRPPELDQEWAEELRRWLRPAGDGRPGVLGWALRLLPERVDPTLRLTEDSLQVFHGLRWTGAAPAPSDARSDGIVDAPVDLGVETRWVAAHRGSTEIGIATTASAGDAEVAESLLVARRPGLPAARFGTRGFERAPEESFDRGRQTLALGVDDVRGFAELVGATYPIHDDPAYARQLGYPDVLAQGLLLCLAMVFEFAEADSGRISVWFRRPVAAGTVLELCSGSAPGEPGLRAIRVEGSGEVAAIAHVIGE